MSGRLRTEFAEAAQSPGLLLWRATNAWQARMRAALKPHGLTHVQFVLLASLVWLAGERPDDPVTQAELAGFAQTDPMMTSQVLRALESMGLVTRAAHPHDRRARLLAPTDDGIARANAANGAVEAADRDFFGALAGGVDRFARDLARLGAR